MILTVDEPDIESTVEIVKDSVEPDQLDKALICCVPKMDEKPISVNLLGAIKRRAVEDCDQLSCDESNSDHEPPAPRNRRPRSESSNSSGSTFRSTKRCCQRSNADSITSEDCEIDEDLRTRLLYEGDCVAYTSGQHLCIANRLERARDEVFDNDIPLTSIYYS